MMATNSSKLRAMILVTPMTVELQLVDLDGVTVSTQYFEQPEALNRAIEVATNHGVANRDMEIEEWG